MLQLATAILLEASYRDTIEGFSEMCQFSRRDYVNEMARRMTKYKCELLAALPLDAKLLIYGKVANVPDIARTHSANRY